MGPRAKDRGRYGHWMSAQPQMKDGFGGEDGLKSGSVLAGSVRVRVSWAS